MGWVAARRGPMRARRLGAIAMAGLILLFVVLRDGSACPGAVDAICPLWLDLDCGVPAGGLMGCSLLAWGAIALVTQADAPRGPGPQRELHPGGMTHRARSRSCARQRAPSRPLGRARLCLRGAR